MTQPQTRYALIGAAGYIAPRLLQAMKDTNGLLACAYDVNDSVGIMDRHFPDAAFFTAFEAFEAHVHDERTRGSALDYVSICSPNFLHKPHMSFALRAGADAICEKPLVLNVSDLDDLERLEQETGQNVYSILQLRLHPAIIALRDKVANGPADKIYDVDLGYFTSRGAWYHASWSSSREALQAQLRDAGGPTVVYYPLPLHQQTAYRNFPGDPEGLSVSEAMAAEVFSLLMHPYLTTEDQDRVIEVLTENLT